MGYELHITRADLWTGSEQHPITQAEWEFFASTHPRLVRAGAVGWTDIGEQPVYSCVGARGAEGALSWRHGQVAQWGEADTAALARIAAELHARLVGDDDDEQHQPRGAANKQKSWQRQRGLRGCEPWSSGPRDEANTQHNPSTRVTLAGFNGS